MRLVIKGGKVFDPGCGWDGVAQDLFIENDRLAAQVDGVDQIIDASGLAVTPAAIDLRSGVAGYGQNYLRLWGGLPSPREVGEAYARQGYTHIHEPFLTLPTANYVHHELNAIPILDTSAGLTVNLRDFDLWLQDPAKLPEVGGAWAYLLENCRALNLRVVEPFVRYRQDFYQHRALSVASVVEALVRVAELTNISISIEASPELLAADLPALPGIHLGALGAALADEDLAARARQLLQQGISADMGLLSPSPRPGLPPLPVKIDYGWFQPVSFNVPPDPEVGRRALQLALEGRQDNLAFSVASLTHTPTSSFASIFSWLADRAERQAEWGPTPLRSNYTIGDWVRSTRTLPAQYLGLPDRGHLRPGARADIALYDFPGPGGASSWRESLGRCRLLLKAGEIVVHNYEVVNHRVAQTRYYRRTQTPANQLVEDICRSRSLRRENLAVRPAADIHWQQVP